MRALNNLVFRLLIRRHPIDPIPTRQHGPKARPGERKCVAGVKGLIAGLRRQRRPLGHVTIQQGGALNLLFVPGREIARKDERLFEMGLDGGVDGERVDDVHCCVFDGAEDERGPDDVPLRGRAGAVG